MQSPSDIIVLIPNPSAILEMLDHKPRLASVLHQSRPGPSQSTKQENKASVQWLNIFIDYFLTGTLSADDCYSDFSPWEAAGRW